MQEEALNPLPSQVSPLPAKAALPRPSPMQWRSPDAMAWLLPLPKPPPLRACHPRRLPPSALRCPHAISSLSRRPTRLWSDWATMIMTTTICLWQWPITSLTPARRRCVPVAPLSLPMPSLRSGAQPSLRNMLHAPSRGSRSGQHRCNPHPTYELHPSDASIISSHIEGRQDKNSIRWPLTVSLTRSLSLDVTTICQ